MEKKQLVYNGTLEFDVILCYSFKNFFGLRDFVHFINYFRRKHKAITQQLVLESLERNFNGTKGFEDICSMFLGKVLPTYKYMAVFILAYR